MKIFQQRIYILLAIALSNSLNLFAVCDNVTASGTIAGNQTACGSYNPSVISNVSFPTGGTGTLEYQWQSSPNGTTWTNIAGATASAYDPSTIASTTYYQRLERRNGCTVYAGTSNTIIKTVNPLPAASITAGGATTFCSPGSVVLTANSVAGTTYQWRKNGSTIAGATNQTYTATTDGSYTVVKTVTATGCTATSNSIVVTVHTPLTTTITENSFGICGASTVLLEVQNIAGATYQWYEGPTLLPGMNQYSINTGHNGIYSCTLTNLCGTYPSNPFTLNNWMLSNMPYGVIDAIGNPSICIGQSVTLYETSGFFSGYQWYKDGTAIPGANNYSYNATLAGNYILRITDWCWWQGIQYDFYSNWISVTNNGGTIPTPSISAGGSTTICQGQSVLLTEVTGPGWTYQWRNGNSNIAGATNSTYSASVSGNYNCVVSNICGNFASNSIAVNVQPVTATITVNGSATICNGTFAVLTSSSAGLNGTYQWKKNGSSIAGATQTTYSATTAGNYTCTITNSCTTVTSNTIAINVSGNCGTGLLFDGGTDYVRVPNNANYSFGTGNFTVEAWVRLNTTITYSTMHLMSNRPLGTSNGFVIEFVQGKLGITWGGFTASYGVNLRDNTCHHIAVSRSSTSLISFYVDGILIGSSTQASYNVTTANPLLIGNDAHIVGYLKGYVMDVRLWGISKTQAQIQAAMNSQLLGTESGLVGYWKFNDGSGQVANDYSPINNDGQLGSTTGSDIYDPTFQATCAITSPVNCNVPSGLNTTNITNTSAQLNWTGATADSFMVRYAVHNTTNFVWKKFSGQPNVTSTTITGLLPATQYDWWVRSLCNGGSSSNYQANPAVFTTTNAPVPCVTPYNLGATNIQNTSATISWTNMVTADTFRVRYSINGTTNYIWKDVNGTGVSSTSLTGLSPNTAYQFQVSSKCNGVTSAYSTSYVFTTLNTPVPCITPYNLGANNIQNTSATITWTNLVTADTFRVRYSVNNTTNYIWKDVNGGGGSSTSLTGLSPNTAYQFQVSSKCNGVTSPYSSPFVFMTLNIPVPCIVPYGLSTTNITNNSARVNWTNLVSADTFRVRYSINGTTNFMWKDVSGAGGTTFAILTGLNPSSTYRWQVRTVCNGVQSAYSQSVIFSTAALREAAITANGGFENLLVYPNPAHTVTTVAFTSIEAENGMLLISDLTGRILYSEAIRIEEGENVKEINIETLPPGIYLMQLTSPGAGDVMLKLVVE